ncbi:hypothetical protein IV417_07385 [Alphaproteobacteria bacterium KMM 3653]|uniref:Uncharacterized protein n=1 Tax=Harenicola maris TaxID=2841044 RepID=A0AAP2CRE5_9RHOB|nr:hypothetical protein [Harenicola maris]
MAHIDAHDEHPAHPDDPNLAGISPTVRRRRNSGTALLVGLLAVIIAALIWFLSIADDAPEDDATPPLEVTPAITPATN